MGRRRSQEFFNRARSLDRGDRSGDSTPTRDEGATGYTPSTKKPRCRDYDEKGFCLRGDMCKFDHGTDAVVLEDSTKVGYQPIGMSEPYVPGLPSGIPFPPPVLSVPPPGYNYSGKRPFEGGYEPPAKRFDQFRGRGRGRGWGKGSRGGGGSTMLAVRNIPKEMNSISHLNNHFSKFGSLVNVQVHFEGDPGSALLTYTSSDEANTAFNSSEAIMNNRFIKVFWHRERGNIKERLNVISDRNNVLVPMEEKDVDMNKEISQERSEAEEVKLKEEKAKAILAIQKNQEMLQSKHEQMKSVEEKRKSALVQQEELIKSKHDLLDGLIEQQKALISKLEKGKAIIKVDEKNKIMKLLKELTASIDRTKEDIKTSLNVGTGKFRTQSEIEKELLDAEMELFTLQQDGEGDTFDAQQKVNALRFEASRGGYSPNTRPPRGRGVYYRGRGRGYSPRGAYSGRSRGRGMVVGTTNIDRRPCSILVTGFDWEEKDEVVAHFGTLGEVTETIEDEVMLSIICKYKTRRIAEGVMVSGKVFGTKSLDLSWYTQVSPESETNDSKVDEVENDEEDDGYIPPQDDYLPPGLQEAETQSPAAQVELNETDDGVAGDINEHLLDEDEEEGDEERSWKRRSNDED